MFAIAVVNKIWLAESVHWSTSFDDLLEVHLDHSIDILTVVESWHGVESVALHHLLAVTPSLLAQVHGFPVT